MSRLSPLLESVQSFLTTDDSYSENVTNSSNDWSNDAENQLCFVDGEFSNIQSMKSEGKVTKSTTPSFAQPSEEVNQNFKNHKSFIQTSLVVKGKNENDPSNQISLEGLDEVSLHDNKGVRTFLKEISKMECSQHVAPEANCNAITSSTSSEKNLKYCITRRNEFKLRQNFSRKYKRTSLKIWNDINLQINISEDAVYLYGLINVTYRNTFKLNVRINTLFTSLEYYNSNAKGRYKRILFYKFVKSKRRKINFVRFVDSETYDRRNISTNTRSMTVTNHLTEDSKTILSPQEIFYLKYGASYYYGESDNEESNAGNDNSDQSKSAKPNTCVHCGQSFSSHSNLLRHVRNNAILKSYSTRSNVASDICNYCYTTFEAKCALKKHLAQVHHSKTNGIAQTQIDSEASDDEPAERQPSARLAVLKLKKIEFPYKVTGLAKKDVTAPSSVVDSIGYDRCAAENDNGSRLKCPVCGRWFVDNDQYVEHYRVHTKERKYKCGSCDRTFEKFHKFKLHRSSHKNREVHDERRTTVKMLTYAELVEHVTRVKKPFVCEFCRKPFGNKRDYMDHYLLHTGEKPFTCDLCGQDFNKERNMKKHRLSHDGKAVVKVQPSAQIANTTSSTYKKLAKKFVVAASKKTGNSNLRDVATRECKENFINSSNIPIIFKCVACGIKFRHKSSVTNHEKFCIIKRGIYTKPSASQKTFATKSGNNDAVTTKKPNLQRCAKVHNSKIRYKCDICNRIFHRRYVFVEHYRSHTGERPFSCGICKTFFTRKSSYLRHCRKNHSSTGEGENSVDNGQQADEEALPMEEDELPMEDDELPMEDDEFLPIDAVEVEMIDDEELSDTTEETGPNNMYIKHEPPELNFDDLFECEYNIDYDTNVTFDEKPTFRLPEQSNDSNSCSTMSTREYASPLPHPSTPLPSVNHHHRDSAAAAVIASAANDDERCSTSNDDNYVEPEVIVIDDAVDDRTAFVAVDDETNDSTGSNENAIFTSAERRPQSKYSFKCGYCNELFTKFGSLHEHIAVHTKSHVCRHCDAFFSDSTTFMSHMRTLHVGEVWYSCDQCDKNFRTKRTFEEHYTIHSEVKPYKCGRCDTPYSSRTSLMRHIKKNCGISCEQCGQMFADSDKLNAHTVVHAAGCKVFKCSNCDVSFYTSDSLWEHYRMCMVDESAKDPLRVDVKTEPVPAYQVSVGSGAGEKKKRHLCDLCDKSFTKRFQLAQHYIIHSGVKPYKCGYCNATFFRNDSLKRHQKKCILEQRAEEMHFLA